MVAGESELDQPGLFDEPVLEELQQPEAAKQPPKSKAVITYSSLSAKTWNCMDCEQLVYEQIMGSGNSGHQIRKARIKRVQGDVELVLCHEHAQLRQTVEQAAAAKGVR